MFHIPKIPTKFGVALQSFCENQNSVQDQDQDHDFTLDFNTRPTFHTYTTPSKLIVPTARIHARTARQPDRQTDNRTDRQTEIFFACCVF